MRFPVNDYVYLFAYSRKCDPEVKPIFDRLLHKLLTSLLHATSTNLPHFCTSYLFAF
jgi:hypothetical protein